MNRRVLLETIMEDDMQNRYSFLYMDDIPLDNA
jgi:hypothetical protein